jgi:hypothetical protein
MINFELWNGKSIDYSIKALLILTAFHELKMAA